MLESSIRKKVRPKSATANCCKLCKCVFRFSESMEQSVNLYEKILFKYCYVYSVLCNVYFLSRVFTSVYTRTPYNATLQSIFFTYICLYVSIYPRYTIFLLSYFKWISHVRFTYFVVCFFSFFLLLFLFEE